MQQESNKIKNIVITGVTGQDGSYMADYLLANTPHRIYGMVRRTAKPDFSNIKEALKNPRFSIVTGDLSDTHSIDTLVKEINPDYFINLGAQSFVGASWKLGEQTLDVTGIGVYRCLEAIKKHTPKCKFYSAGSSEEWGKVVYSPQDEKHPLCPQSPYGAAKCLANHLVRVYRESYNLFAIHGHLFNHESERRGAEFVSRKITKGVARIANAIKNGQNFDPIELGNLNAKRDWSHAKDFVEGIWLMLNQEKPESYVLSSNETHTVREFVEKAFAAASLYGNWGFCGEVIPENEVFTLSTGEILVRINPAFYRPAEVDILWGDSTRARAELDWKPKYTFDELVKCMVDNDLSEISHESSKSV